jgi:nicotinamidase/pyrazinamidase
MSSRPILHLLIVDPQNDFCIADDGFGNKGALVVPGADADMVRLSAMITRLGTRIDDISVTLDSHQTIGIERPRWWKRVSDGAEPAPFTCLGIHPDGRRIVAYVVGGSNPNAFGMSPTEEAYTTYMPEMLHQGGPTGKGSFGYLQALAARGRYPHIVWTEHCRVGSWGASIVPVLDRALYTWERNEFGRINYIAKGNNPWTEHFSGVAAEVPDPADPSTQMNTQLIQTLEQATKIAVTGEALSHCVANTGRDIGDAFSDPRYIEKLVLITDCSSNVGGFDFLGTAFVNDLKAKGMQLSTSVDFLA